MRALVSKITSAAFLAAIAAAFLIFCPASPSLVGVPLSSAALAQIWYSNPKNQTLFVAERGHHAIDIVTLRTRRMQRIDGPVGNLATDKYGDLFVADFLGLNYVNEYKPPYNGTPIRISLMQNQIAWGVASDARTGILAVISVTNLVGSDYISFFRHNSTTPCNVVSSNSNVEGFGTTAAFDAEGTLFFEAETDGGEVITVASLAGECDAKSPQALSFAQPIDPYGYMAFDGNDNFVIQAAVEDKPGPIYTYKHPQNGTFGPPIATTSLAFYGGSEPTLLALSSDGKSLWAGDYYGHDVLLFPYPGIDTTAPALIMPNIPHPLSGAVFPSLVP